MDQGNMLKNIVEVNRKSRPRTIKDKYKKETYESTLALYEDRDLILNACKIVIFPIKNTRKRPKILTPKQMIQRLPIALAQVKAGTTSNKKTSLKGI